MWVPVGVAVVGLVIALGAFLASREDPPDFTLAGTELAPEATAEVRIIDTPAGIILRLEVAGLEPAPPGTYYQGWVVSADGEVSVGTFHMRGGDGSVAFWSGVETERYPTLVVTLQEENAGPARSETVVLTGRA
ncbi:MAG: anti-sigma factor [Acidimicrobiia bacterium]